MSVILAPQRVCTDDSAEISDFFPVDSPRVREVPVRVRVPYAECRVYSAEGSCCCCCLHVGRLGKAGSLSVNLGINVPRALGRDFIAPHATRERLTRSRAKVTLEEEKCEKNRSIHSCFVTVWGSESQHERGTVRELYSQASR